jgi:hypothetical protein
MTETERRRIAGLEDVEDIKRYQAISRVRSRIEDELTQDIAILTEHHEGLLDEIREVVCEDVEGEDIAVSGSSEDAEIGTEGDVIEPVVEGDRTDTEAKEEIYEESDATEPPTDETDAPDISSRVWGIVEDVAEGWDDDDRLQNRKQAAAEVLQHAVETGEPVGKSSEIVEEVREKYPVVGQNEETYWRKNIRDVLSEVGNYSRGSHKYTVSSLEEAGENDE